MTWPLRKPGLQQAKPVGQGRMSSMKNGPNFRIGQGFDVHAFAAGDHVVLCGVRVPHEAGLEAHSDGDVALHALCDALLGAAALGDIGTHFPPGDSAYRNADSRKLTRTVMSLLNGKGWSVNNADITIICEAPKISLYADQMRANVSEDLGIDSAAVSVKATTTEGLGFCGRREGVAAMAVVSLVSTDSS